MIAKLSTGTGFANALGYDERVGWGDKFMNTFRVLDARGVTFDYDHAGQIQLDLKQIPNDFNIQAKAYQGRNPIRKPVYHWVLSYHPDDGVSDAQMLADAKDFLARVGFVDTQYVITAHHDKKHAHVHILTNVVNDDGRRINTQGLIDRAHAAARAITTEKGYTWGQRQTMDILQHPSVPMHDKLRMHMSHVVRAAVAESCNFDELKEKLLQQNVSCRFQMATDGKRGRFSIAVNYKGVVHTFNGSSLAKDLSFYHLNRKLKLSFNPRDVLLTCARFDDVLNEMQARNTAFKPIYNERNGSFTDIVFRQKNKDDIKASELLSKNEMNELTNHWNQVIEPAAQYHDAALENIKIILAELGKPGPSPFKNTHGNPVGRNKNNELYEQELAEGEQRRQEADAKGLGLRR